MHCVELREPGGSLSRDAFSTTITRDESLTHDSCASVDALTSSACRRRLRLSGENGSAGILIMGVARLELLGDGVHVAKPPLERIRGEDGGGAGHVIGGVDHDSRLMNGPGRGDAQRDAMRFGHRLAAFQDRKRTRLNSSHLGISYA